MPRAIESLVSRSMVATLPDADTARARLADVLLRTGSEDRTAFRDLYTLTSAKLFGICLRICGERQAAEDVLHDVYLTIWKRAGAWEPGRASPIDDAPDIADEAPDAESMLLSGEAAHRLHHCLDTLEARQRSAIRTAFFDGVTYAELAERGNVPLGTMKSWVRRGLGRLKDCLDGD